MKHFVNFGGERCRVEFRTYTNGRPAIQLVCADGQIMATATVNLPDVPIPDGHVFIKDWSENAGIVGALQLAGIVEPCGRRVPTEFVEAVVCRLLVKP